MGPKLVQQLLCGRLGLALCDDWLAGQRRALGKHDRQEAEEGDNADREARAVRVVFPVEIFAAAERVAELQLKRALVLGRLELGDAPGPGRVHGRVEPGLGWGLVEALNA